MILAKIKVKLGKQLYNNPDGIMAITAEKAGMVYRRLKLVTPIE